MISLVITADSTNVDCVQKDKDLGDLLAKFKTPFEILYVANEDFKNLDDLRFVAKSNLNRKLVVTTRSTNKNTQIYTALDHTDNGDVLLATLDTNLDLITVMLQKRQNDAELVFVKTKENFFKSIFTGLGQWTYKMGLKLLGRGQDMCCDSQVVLLNNRSVNTIILNPAFSKALRIVNPDPDRESATIVAPKIYDSPAVPEKKAARPFFTLGISTLLYLIGFLLIAVAFPINNSNVYTIWILVGLILWILAGIVGAILVARYTYEARLGLPIALDLAGEPVINIHSLIINQQEFDSNGILVKNSTKNDEEHIYSNVENSKSSKSSLSEKAEELKKVIKKPATSSKGKIEDTKKSNTKKTAIKKHAETKSKIKNESK